ncbi:unnamed protein product [Mycena citricolor]|uniref:Transmembrane protein n=1 Tax=Mycena citricolor TaxID=2018698 RepID=A0AAD2H8U6_9AGAR|nr:unnamed protein product [Mycena citricolor]
MKHNRGILLIEHERCLMPTQNKSGTANQRVIPPCSLCLQFRSPRRLRDTIMSNFTIDNINPRIQYTPPGAWTEGTSANDPLAGDYFKGTFTLCTTKGSAATFSFNGTQVFVGGAMRSNHGPYSVNLDGVTQTIDGFSQNALFSNLFVSNVLPEGLHTVSITNELTDPSAPFLDIDYITWTSSVSPSAFNQAATVEDTSNLFSFTPAAAWTSQLAPSLTGFSGSSGHQTTSDGASASLSFTGNFVSVFGAVGPLMAPYGVLLDGVPQGTFNATKQTYFNMVELFHADDLASGDHVVSFVAAPAAPGQIFALDFAKVPPASVAGSKTSSGSAAGPTGTGSANNASSSQPANTAAIAGGVVGGVAVLGILLLLFLFLRRKQRGSHEYAIDELKSTPPTHYNMDHIGPDPYQSYSRSALVGSHSQHSHSAYEESVMSNPWPTSDVSPPPLPPLPAERDVPRRGFYTVNHTRDPSNSASEPSTASASVSAGRRTSTHTAATSAGAAGLGTGVNGKGMPVVLPPTANTPLPAGASRMVVEGRAQDMGPLSPALGPLPPDYAQATQPYYPPRP